MITFPPGVLGKDPVRLAVVGCKGGVLAVAKPAGIGIARDVLEPSVPLLGEAFSKAVADGKTQLRAFGLQAVQTVLHVDAEISGIALFAASAGVGATVRNQIGSRQCECVYDVLASESADFSRQEFECDLPLVRDEPNGRVRVSHAAGKKCATRFVRGVRFGKFSLWEARTRDHRVHQVRVHAAECGLSIPGELLYGRVPFIFLSSLKPRYRPGRRAERPLHGAICMHLREVLLASEGAHPLRFVAARPLSLAVLLRRLAESAGLDESVVREHVDPASEISLSE